jgi:hypothetical protein
VIDNIDAPELLRYLPATNTPRREVSYHPVSPAPGSDRDLRELRDVLRRALKQGLPLTLNVQIRDADSLRALLKGRAIPPTITSGLR